MRHEILRAALRHDTAAMRPYLAEQFLSSHGGAGGIDEFFGSLTQVAGQWNKLVEVLALGGGFSRRDSNSFLAPTTSALGIECVEPPRVEPTTADTTDDRRRSRFSCDPYELLYVYGPDTRVRETPGGRVLRTLTLAAVARDRERGDGTRTADGVVWAPVILPDDSRGWIAERLLRSPIGHRAHFVKGEDGKWRMRAFIAGD